MTFPNLQPILMGENTVVRPILEDDRCALFTAASDPKIWEVHPASDRYVESVFNPYFDGAIASQSAFVFVDKASEVVFGTSRYYGYDPILSEIEIGWTFMDRSHWGGEYNREIKGLLLNHAFSFVDTVVFWVAVDNLRSQGAMKKIGGVLRPGVFTREESGGVPHIIFEITKDNWAS